MVLVVLYLNATWHSSDAHLTSKAPPRTYVMLSRSGQILGFHRFLQTTIKVVHPIILMPLMPTGRIKAKAHAMEIKLGDPPLVATRSVLFAKGLAAGALITQTRSKSAHSGGSRTASGMTGSGMTVKFASISLNLKAWIQTLQRIMSDSSMKLSLRRMIIQTFSQAIF
jgi:hypothetical protein